MLDLPNPDHLGRTFIEDKHLSPGNQGGISKKLSECDATVLANDLRSALADRRSVRDLHELKSIYENR